jgi:uroporphyrinogen-III synthase
MNARVEGARKVTKVVITRSKKGNAGLAKSLAALGFEPIEIETIEFLPPQNWSRVDSSLRGLGLFDWVLFTSATGVEFFADRMRVLGLPISWRGRPAVAAVGAKTSAALQREGIAVDFVPEAYLTRALAEGLPTGRGLAVLMLRADISDPEAVATLEANGFEVTDLAIYRTSPTIGAEGAQAHRAVAEADAIIFASPSAVEAFVGKLGPAGLAPLAGRALCVCIGPVTAAAARRQGFERVITPKTHTVEGVVQELSRAARGEVG